VAGQRGILRAAAFTAENCMFDLRPPFYIIGQILVAVGGAMLIPAVVDYLAGAPGWATFLECALVTSLTGALTAIACGGTGSNALSIRQAFLMTAAVWILVPLFGALPLMLGMPHLSFTDAYFESVSGITTTGATVIFDTEKLPPGTNLWRGLLTWMGGLGFSFVAMVFLPFLRVGGMRFFQTQGFDTMGKILPRAADIAGALLRFYLLLTLVVFVTYLLLGMSALDAAVHAFATVSCGGFSTSDDSFGRFSGAVEYAGSLFMVISSMPFIRFVQLMQGSPRPLWRDSQARTYLALIAIAVGAVVIWRLATTDVAFEPALRETLFNLISIFSGTGFGSASVASWGAFAVGVAFVIGNIGGCTSSASAAMSIFRWQIAFLAIRRQIRRLYAPSRVEKLKYEGRVVEDDVLNPVIAFFTFYVLLFGIFSVLLGLSGIDTMSAIFAVWTSLGNVGVGFGDIVSRTGTMIDVPEPDKWVLILAMLMGRLGVMPMIVLCLPRFWRG
jgi:trk system potassium uptake protein TrkH